MEADAPASKVHDEPRCSYWARLLLVEDDESIRALYCRLLSDAGYYVRAVATAEAALELLSQDIPDLILLDLKLPGIDGLEFLRRLRNFAAAPAVLLLSGCATIEEAAAATRLGVTDVMEKPYNPAALLARVERLLAIAKDPILCWIREHLAEIRSRNDVAQYFRVSPGTVTNRIRRQTGQSFTAFIQGCRIQAAQRLLSTSQLEVKVIAARVGFLSPQTMDRTFRRRTGCTPSQYRQEIRNAGN